MIDRPGEASRDALQVWVAEELEVVATGQWHAEEARIEPLPERRRGSDVDGQLHAIHNGGHIVGMAEIARIDQRMVVGVPRA